MLMFFVFKIHNLYGVELLKFYFQTQLMGGVALISDILKRDTTTPFSRGLRVGRSILAQNTATERVPGFDWSPQVVKVGLGLR